METRVEFIIKDDDLIAYHSYFQLFSPKAKRKHKEYRIFFVITAILAILFGLVFWTNKIMAIPAFLYSLYIFCFIPFEKKLEQWQITRYVRWRYGKGKNEVIGNHKFTVMEDKIVDVKEKGESSTRWGLIEEVSEVENYLFMTIRASSDFYIIPRRVFATDAAFNQFVETVKNLHQAALIKRQTF